jgi:hypothetical protein
VVPGPGAATATAQAAATPPTATATGTLPAGATRTPGPRGIHTEGEGLIVTLKPGQPASLPADGKSQTTLIVDVDPYAACWGGPDVLHGHIHIMAETTLGDVFWPGSVSALELPAEVSLTAPTVAGQAVITIQGAYCPREEVIVFGVCTDPAAKNRRCTVKTTVHIDPPQ